jgi:hypothetical protein
MAECLYTNTECIKFPVDDICANCIIRLTLADIQFASTDWQQKNGFVMIEKCCHTCEYGAYENQEDSNQAVLLICKKMTDSNYNAEVIDPKRYVCKKWKQRNMYEGIE